MLLPDEENTLERVGIAPQGFFCPIAESLGVPLVLDRILSDSGPFDADSGVTDI